MASIIVMGATGSGKSTVGSRLAERLDLPFVEGDDYHDEASIARMRRGEPLDDARRGPWLDRLNRVLREHARDRGVVMASSALTEAYRRRLTRGVDGVQFVFLRAGEDLLRQRLAGRHGHFAGAALVPSQLATLEPPRDAITVDARRSPDAMVDEIVATLTGAHPGYDSTGFQPGEETVAQLPTPDEETDTETLLRELGDIVAALLDTNDLTRRQELWAQAKPRIEIIDRLI